MKIIEYKDENRANEQVAVLSHYETRYLVELFMHVQDFIDSSSDPFSEMHMTIPINGPNDERSLRNILGL